MERVKFGSTDIFVTSLCVGTVDLGNLPEVAGFQVSEEMAEATIRKALEGPIRFMDTSENYGAAQTIIGRVLRQIGGLPEDFVLQSKVDRDSQTGDFSGEQVKKSFMTSLDLLGVDYLQIVYIHDPEHTTFEHIMSAGGAWEVLQRFKEQGLIGYVGISGAPIEMLLRYVKTDAFDAVITHNRYNLLSRVAEPLIEETHKRNMALLNAAPFGSGIFADSSNRRFAYRDANSDELKRVQKMREICSRFNISLKSAALHFSLRDHRITSTIVGPTDPKHIDDYLAILDEKIPDEVFEEIDKLAVYRRDPQGWPTNYDR